MIRRVSVWVLVAGFFLFLPVPAHAANSPGFDLTISPLPINLTTMPGKPVNTELRVQNSSIKPAIIHISLLKFKAEADTGHPRLLDRQPGDTFFDWVSFSKNNFLAAPGEWTSLTMTIKPPDSAAFGYYYAVVFSNGQGNTQPVTTNTASLHGAVASLVLLDVKTTGEKRQLQLASFNSNRHFYEFLPADFTIRVKNSGNIHAQPSGSIYISRGSKVIDTLDVNPTSGNILPDSTRTFTASWNNGFPHYEIKSGQNGQTKKHLKWDFSKVNHLRFGHYTARLVLVYDNGSKDIPLQATVSFWVIPWRLIGIVLFIMLLIAGLITYVIILRRRLKRVSGSHKTKPEAGKK